MWNLLSEFFLICHFSLIFSLMVLCIVFFSRTRDGIVGRLLLILSALFIHSIISLFYYIFAEEFAVIADQLASGVSLFLLFLTCITVPLIIYGVSSYMLSLLELPAGRYKIGRMIIIICAAFFFIFGLYFIIFLHGDDWTVSLLHALNELFIYGSIFLLLPAISAAVFLPRTINRRKKQLLRGIIISFMPVGLFGLLDSFFLIESPYKLVYLSYVTFSVLVYLFTARYFVYRYAPEDPKIPLPGAQLYKNAGISDREQELIPLLLEGRSNKEISELLFISTNTVKTHIRNIYRKLGVSNRLQLLSKIR